MQSKVAICLTIHNSGHQLERVLRGIYDNAATGFFAVFCLDGCSDHSEEVLCEFLYDHYGVEKSGYAVLKASNVYETRANNLCLREAHRAGCEYAIIVQDDMQIEGRAFDERLLKPFFAFDDVFSVTGRTAHNFRYNAASPFNDPNYASDGWSTLIEPCDKADRHDNSLSRDIFYIRQSVNRGPLALNLKDVAELGFLPEEFVMDSDEHWLNLMAREKLNKVAGFYHINWTEGKGGTKDEHGNTKTWLKKLQQKNSRTVYERFKDLIAIPVIEERKLL